MDSPCDFSQVSSGSIDQRMQTQQSIDEDASSRINDHADARFGAKMRRYGSAPGMYMYGRLDPSAGFVPMLKASAAFAGLFPQRQRSGTQPLLASKRNELDRIREYFRTITDAALDSLPEIYNILQSIGQAHPFIAGTWDLLTDLQLGWLLTVYEQARWLFSRR